MSSGQQRSWGAVTEQEPDLGLFQRARAREAFSGGDVGLSSEGTRKVTWQKRRADRKRRVQTENFICKSPEVHELQTLGEMEEKHSCSLVLYPLTLLSSLYNPTNWHVTSLVAQTVKHLPTMRESQVRSLGRDNPLEKETAPHSSTLAWKIPWREEPGGLQSMGSQRVRQTERFHFPFVVYCLFPSRTELQESRVFAHQCIPHTSNGSLVHSRRLILIEYHLPNWYWI